MTENKTSLFNRPVQSPLGMLILTFVLLMGAAFYLGVQYGVQMNLGGNSAGIWFDDLSNRDSVSDRQAELAASYIIDSVLGTDLSSVQLDQIDDTRSPQIVFVSMSEGDSLAVVLMGQGKSLQEAVALAGKEVQRKTFAGFTPIWVKVDIVKEVYHIHLAY